MVVSNIQRFGGGPDKCVNSVFEGIRQGGEGWEQLRFAAATLDDMGGTRLAKEIIDGAIVAAPPEESASFEYTRALVNASLGDAAGALKSIEVLAAHHPQMARGIGSYIRALFPVWEYWPAADSRRRDLDRLKQMLLRTTARKLPELEPFRAAIQKSATRIVRYRQKLQELFGDRDWIAPDLSALLPDGPVEMPVPELYAGVGNQHLCRQEWTRLVWLCYFAGLDKLALPTEIVAQDDCIPLQIVGYARLLMAYGEDPAERLSEMLKASTDVAKESDHAAIVELARELAGESDWFTLKIAEVQDHPDPSFLHKDEGAFMSVMSFFSDTDSDIFDEEDEDEEDEDE
jgi:hypothetical protein